MRAIILAAGMGSRLRPLTLETPKPLLVVNGEPMIERQIKFLKQKNINEIIIVTGYLANKFDYLVAKYGVKLVHNDKYDQYNNLYTMYLVKDYLSDAYVLEADVYLNENIFNNKINKSTYFGLVKEDFKNEWILNTTNNNLISIDIGDSDKALIMSGISYWCQNSGKVIQDLLNKAVNSHDFTKLFWDNLVKDNINEFSINVEVLEIGSTYEIDTVAEYEAINELLLVK